MKALYTMHAKRRWERGYALMLVLFLATLMLILAMAAAPNILTEGRREKEKEMIWRGKQYVRGIKLYYRKMGRFPTSLDDLTKPQMGEIRFMRKAYKDPMNTTDGSWRLIYVGPGGQLIGSLRPPETLKIPGTLAGSLGTPASILAAGQNPSGQNSQQNEAGSSATGQGNSANAPGSSGSTSDQNNDLGEIPTGETPTIIGGNIIGVGSKVNHASVMVYNQAKNYRLFEFIWDPSKEPITLGGTSTQLGGPAPGTLGQSPFGITPTMPPLTTGPAPPPPQPPASNPNLPQN